LFVILFVILILIRVDSTSTDMIREPWLSYCSSFMTTAIAIFPQCQSPSSIYIAHHRESL